MAFNSLEYATLFLIAFAGNWLLSNKPRTRVLFLLTASYIFYASWVPKYLLLIILSSTIDFFVGKAIFTTSNTVKKKMLLATSLTINLGILAAFKYFNFFAEEFTNLMGVFGFHVSPWHLKFLLPVGISFYTFQSLSYTIDIYRKQLEPVHVFSQYLLFVAFFPQLVAGPIVRAKHLLPQLISKPAITAEQGSNAIFLITFGLLKKIVIADFLGAHLVDPIFSAPHMYSSVETLLATYGYAFQIYADFSAYSDIAIGSAALLGLTIPINFNAPYVSSNLREFWQRWHISLSTWLRDYLYIPMGGSKHGSARTYTNLLITMIIGGLWHGAALTFLFWGTIHGLALVLTRVIQRSHLRSFIPAKIQKALGIFLTFHVVCIAWIFFRSADFESARAIFEAIALLDFATNNLNVYAVGILIAALAVHWIPANWITRAHTAFHQIPAPIQAGVAIAFIAVATELAHVEVAPFIYFQF